MKFKTLSCQTMTKKELKTMLKLEVALSLDDIKQLKRILSKGCHPDHHKTLGFSKKTCERLMKDVNQLIKDLEDCTILHDSMVRQLDERGLHRGNTKLLKE